MADELAAPLDEQFDGEMALPDSVDEAAVRRMRFVAYLLDESVRVPGTSIRVGLDPILGIVPGGGDAVSAALSAYIVVESARLGVPFLTLLRMVANVSLDFAVGSVPVLGTLFDAVWKANKRNFELALSELSTATEEESDDAEPVTIAVE
ncbi:DUF4112 domain-containing protein [Natronomonas marina]|jgi:hypothetical protein|uniref:DUF4112 domain-containing protein n=1 Tax=Natronomonas marina TaxID=2961939 RepID=UPI0020CA2221|nr:DUF4112 domain-containing protein [Natronomonas marina]